MKERHPQHYITVRSSLYIVLDTDTLLVSMATYNGHVSFTIPQQCSDT